MIRAIFFDLHKVITHGDFEDIYKIIANRLKVSVDVVSDYHKEKLDSLLTGEVTSEHMLEAFGLDNKFTVEQMLDIWTEETLKIMYADKNILLLLTKLREKYMLGALTNLTEQRYGADIKMGLYNYFDFSILSFKEGVKKPDSIFFLKALEKAGCAPEESILIDDQAKNTEAAERIGIKSIQYDNYEDLLKRMVALSVDI